MIQFMADAIRTQEVPVTDPELLSLMRGWKRDILSSICRALPGAVQSFDPATRTASVLPTLRRNKPAGDPADV